MIAKGLLAGLGLSLWATAAEANPDVWVDAHVVFRFEDAKVTAVTYEWSFDRFFSLRTLHTFDANGNGALDPDEVRRLRAEAFDPLLEVDYFVHVWVDGERRTDHRIDEFTARIEDRSDDRIRESALVFRFSVALTPPVDPGAHALVVSLRDEEVYVDFRLLEKDFLRVEGTMAPGCRFRVGRGRGAQSGHKQPITLKC